MESRTNKKLFKSEEVKMNDELKQAGEECWADFVKYSAPSKRAIRNTNWDDWQGMCYMKYAIRFLGEEECRKRLKALEGEKGPDRDKFYDDDEEGR